jgi:AAA+ ATPase superfamily predicted ATPase
MEATNPFYERGMIRDPERVFDREEELNTIFGWLRNMQSVSIVGERRVGKSSLMNVIVATGPQQLGEGYEFYYLDLQGLESTEDFVAQALKELKASGSTLRALRNVIEERQRVILCLDEFEWSSRFSDEFSGSLRNMASSGHLALVVASKRKLSELAAEGSTTSPFFNIFLMQPLKGFSQEGSGDLLNWLGKPVGRIFSSAEIEAAYKETDGNPGKLQILGFYLYAMGDLKKALEAYRIEVGQEDGPRLKTFRPEAEAFIVGDAPQAQPWPPPGTERAALPAPSIAGAASAVLLIMAAVVGFLSALLSFGWGIILMLVLVVIAVGLELQRTLRQRGGR